MKHKNIIKSFFIAICLAMLGGCEDDPVIEKQSEVNTPEGRLSEMKQYFESTSPTLKQIQFGKQQPVTSRNVTGHSHKDHKGCTSFCWGASNLSPDWKKARVWDSYKKFYAEIPLKGKGLYCSSFLNTSRQSKSYPVRSFLVLVNDKITGAINYHVVTTVVETQGRRKPLEEDFHFIGNGDFKGFILFSKVDGTYVKSLHIRDHKSHLIHIGPLPFSTRASDTGSASLQQYEFSLTPSVVRYSYDESGGGSTSNQKECLKCYKMYDSDLYSECPDCDSGSGGDSGGSGDIIYCLFCGQPYDVNSGGCRNGCEIVVKPEDRWTNCNICGFYYNVSASASCPMNCEALLCSICGKYPCDCFSVCERCGDPSCPGPWSCSESDCTGEKCDVCGGYKTGTRSGSNCPECTCVSYSVGSSYCRFGG